MSTETSPFRNGTVDEAGVYLTESYGSGWRYFLTPVKDAAPNEWGARVEVIDLRGERKPLREMPQETHWIIVEDLARALARRILDMPA